MLKVEEFINQHKYEDWASLLKQAPYFLKANEDADYILLKYDMVESDFTQDIVKECRGIIIDKHPLKAVALSFFKFFNIQEPLHDEIDWKSARVTEKIDGSKILCWFNKYKNKWQISTSGTLDAYTANVNDSGLTFGQLFEQAVKNSSLLELNTLFDKLDHNYCYTFELVSPESRIVVPYKKTELYFLSFRNKYTFEEFNPKENFLSNFIKTPKEYPLHSLEDCLKATEKMGFDEEGFVVVDDNWDRVKIKSLAYVQAHYTRMNEGTSYSRILDMIEFGSDGNFLKIYPEYQDKFDSVKNAKQEFEDKLSQAINATLINKDALNLNRKEIAEYINTEFKNLSAFLFKFIDTDLIKLFIETEWDKLPKNRKLKYLGFKEEKDAGEFKEE